MIEKLAIESLNLGVVNQSDTDLGSRASLLPQHLLDGSHHLLRLHYHDILAIVHVDLPRPYSIRNVHARFSASPGYLIRP